MVYKCKYSSPIGLLWIVCDEHSIIGLFMEGQKYFFNTIDEEAVEKNHALLICAKKWLDAYFSKQKPSIQDLPLNPKGTPFQKEVWDILCTIPYGEVWTYKDIAQIIAYKRGKEKMSCQAIGQAIGHNPISILIPCHRVVGSNGSLTGYAGGVERKRALLDLEAF